MRCTGVTTGAQGKGHSVTKDKHDEDAFHSSWDHTVLEHASQENQASHVPACHGTGLVRAETKQRHASAGASPHEIQELA